MWAWLKKLFGFGISKDNMFLIRKIIRVSVYAILRNNPAFAPAVAAAIADIEVLIRDRSAAALVQQAVERGLDELAHKATQDKLIQAEIIDLKNLIKIEVEQLPEDEKLAKLAEIVEQIKTGLDASRG